jgi:hypothetical protein
LIFDIFQRGLYNDSNPAVERTTALAKREDIDTANKPAAADIERLIQHIDALDKRLDSVDSVVSAVAERVMRQPITLNLTCPKCGQRMEIAIIGTEKPGR